MSDPRDPYPCFGEPPVSDLEQDTESSAEVGDTISAYCAAARAVLPQAHFRYARRFRHPDGEVDELVFQVPAELLAQVERLVAAELAMHGHVEAAHPHGIRPVALSFDSDADEPASAG
jgi:hypothetical protein